MAKLEPILADTFLVERRLPCPSGVHRRFEARRRSAPEAPAVMLSCAQYMTPLSPDALQRQREMAERMRTSPYPSLVPLIDAVFEPDYQWMTSSLPTIGSVHEHLREHRKLPIEEVEWLLRVLAGTLTAAVAKSWPRITLDPQEIRLDLRAREVMVLLPDMPIFGANTAVEMDPLQTMAFNPATLAPALAPVPSSTCDYVTPLAQLCCELLGEQEMGGPGGNERFRPLAALSAQQNRILRAALVGLDRHGFDSVNHFVSEFTGMDAAAVSVAYETTRRTTAVTPPPLPVKPVKEESRLLEAYTLEEELRILGPCAVWSAQHTTLGEVIISSVDFSTEVAEVSRRLQSMMSSLRTADAKLLVVPADILSDGKTLHVVRKKPASQLLDALRQSRSLEKPAVARLIASMLAAYESLWALIGRRMVAMSLDQFWLQSETPGGPPSLSSLRLDAAQVILDHEYQPQFAMRPIEHFARVTLHLLGHDGGSLAGGSPLRFSPIPELDSGTNELLRNALDPARTGEVSLNAFFARISAALAGHTAMSQLRQKRSLKVSTEFSAREIQPISRARLMPDTKDAPILAIAATDEILIGRGAEQADLVTRFAPRSPLNDSRTRSVSRVQIKGVIKGGQIMLEDVAGANPSMIDRQRLDAATAIDLPTTLLLGSEYPVELRQARSSHPPGGLQVEGWPEVKRRGQPSRSTTLVLPASSGVLKMELAWLRGDIGLRIGSPSGTLHFCAADDLNCVARLHHHGSCLWLEAVAEEALIKVADVELRQGELVPLWNQDVIGIGARRLLLKEFLPEEVPVKTDLSGES